MNHSAHKSQTPIQVRIESLGQGADGVAMHENRSLYIPRALEGELVTVEKSSADKAILLSVEEASPHRVQPLCPHYASCGGCSMQHMDEQTYKAFKKHKVEAELKRHAVVYTQMDEPIFIPVRTRRRTALKVQNSGGKISLGYFAQSSHKIVDIHSCLVVMPEIEALLEPLKSLFKQILPVGLKGEVRLTHTPVGTDIEFDFTEKQQLRGQGRGQKSAFSKRGGHKKNARTAKSLADNFDLSLDMRHVLTEFAQAHQLARLSVQQKDFLDPVVCYRTPSVSFNDVLVPISASSFLQASAEADTAMANFIVQAVQNEVIYLKENQGRDINQENSKLKIADLFSGRGTLSFPLAKFAQVSAYEADKPSLDVLSTVALENKLDLQGESRNLFEEPLTAEELNVFDVVVMDPPRAGAKAQSEMLAKSDVRLVISISCNAATFARDTAILQSGGYVLQKITPLDQFIYTPHTEVMAVFCKNIPNNS